MHIHKLLRITKGNKSHRNGPQPIHFSSPEPLGSQGELIVYPLSQRPSVIRRSPFSKIFFSEIAWLIKATFYV